MASHNSEDCNSVTEKLKDANRLVQFQSAANQPPENWRQDLSQSLGRQTSIYSLTLNEFQTSLSQSNKDFGSMNMDEFMNNIFMDEENPSQGIPLTPLMSTPSPFPMQEISVPINQAEGMILYHQPSLPRQSPLNIPKPLCRKTLEQVYAELQNDDDDNIHEMLKNTNTSQKQPTFGEMSLEDFLYQAGVMREPQGYGHMLQPPQQQPPGFNQMCGHLNFGHNFPMIPVMETDGWVNIAKANHELQSGMTENEGGNQQMPRGNGNGGGYMILPAIPSSSDGMGKNKVDGEKSEKRGQKRTHNVSVEKMVDMKQKRMLKNRVSAAQSRERKQAYALVLEEELSLLTEEIKQLRQSLTALQREKQLKKQYDEEEATRENANMGTKSDKVTEKSNMQYHEDEAVGANADMRTKTQKVNENLKGTRRSCSCPR